MVSTSLTTVLTGGRCPLLLYCGGAPDMRSRGDGAIFHAYGEAHSEEQTAINAEPVGTSRAKSGRSTHAACLGLFLSANRTPAWAQFRSTRPYPQDTEAGKGC